MRVWPSAWRRALRAACIGLFASGLCATAAAADEDAMAKFARTGRIVLGSHDAALPISYRGPDGAHIGYYTDICERIVGALRQRLDLPQLRSVTVPILMTTRMAMLNNGTIDMDCGPNPMTSAAMRQSLLSHATMVFDVTMMTIAEKRDYTLATLEGKSIGTLVGAPTVSKMRAAARDNKFSVKEVFVRDGFDAFAMLADGRIDAFPMPAPFLLALRASVPDPERYVLLDIPLGRFYDGIGFRLADERLRAIANETIVALAATGELARLYDKWFMQQIPGMPRPIGAPASAAQRELFAHPGSETLGM